MDNFHYCDRKECKNRFTKRKRSDSKKYCSRNCAAIVNNISRTLSEETKKKIAVALTTTGKYVRINKSCLYCSTVLNKGQLKYCSIKCQSNYNYQLWLQYWKIGIKTGSVGIHTKNISAHLKRYLHEKFGNKCSKCGWSKKHPITGNVPLEIDHMDGNAENNKESNLQLLCPNCHALTPFFKNLNKGNGRKWRMDKYVKNI